MTALQSNLPTLATLPDIDQLRDQARQQRQQLVDQLIGQNRLNIPASVVNKRRRERLTIEQINRLSTEGIRQGLSPIDSADDRSPLVRFLDVIDLPRNTVANAVFGDASLGQKAGAVGLTAATGAAFGSFVPGIGTAIGAGVGAGIGLLGIGLGEALVGDELQSQITLSSERRGTFAQPVIFGSDILKALGVENKVARAVAGFAGDIMLDPLTYLTGGGNVVTWTAKNGARIRVAKPAQKMLQDIGEHIRVTGNFPTDLKYQPLRHFYETTVRSGGDAFAWSGRETKKRIARVLAGELTAGAFEQTARGEFAREFFRRYAAVSDRQFTFPFFGLLANSLRTPLDMPIGRLGRAGEFRRALGASERELTLTLERRHSELSKALNVARETAEQTAAARIAALTPERLESIVPDEIRRAEEALIGADLGLERATDDLRRFEESGLRDVLLGMDSMQSVFAQGDAATTLRGPAGMLRRMPWGVRRVMEVRDKIASVNRTYRTEQYMMRLEQARLKRALSQLDELGVREGGSKALRVRRRELETLRDELTSLRERAQAAARGETDDVAFPVPVPEVPSLLRQKAGDTVEYSYRIRKTEATADDLTSNVGKTNTVEVRFDDELDRLIWEASLPLGDLNRAQKQSRRAARDYIKATFGRGDEWISRAGREMRQTVEDQIARGRPVRGGVTSAGVSAGPRSEDLFGEVAEGGRIFEFRQSPKVRERRGLSIDLRDPETGTLRSARRGRLFADMPADVRRELDRIDRMVEAAEDQAMTLDDAVIGRTSGIERDIATLDDMLATSGSESARVLAELGQQEKLAESNTFYRIWKAALGVQDDLRAKIGLGTKNTPIREIFQRYNIANENQIPLKQAQMRRAFEDRIQALSREMPGIETPDISLAVLARISNDSELVGFHRHDDIWTQINTLRSKPYGNELINDPRVAQLAREYTEHVENFRKIETDAGLLTDVEPTRIYFQNSLTDDAAAAARQEAARFGGFDAAQRASALGDPKFTLSKATNRIFFGDGPEDFIWSGELIRARTARSSLDAEQRVRIRRFEEWLQREREIRGDDFFPEAVPTSPYELNRRRTHFYKMVPEEAGPNIFEDDFLLSLVSRTGQHHRALLAQKFKNELIGLSRIIDPRRAKAGFYPKAEGGGIMVDGMRYRQLNAQKVRNASLRVPLDDDALRYFYPEALAQEIEDFASKFRSNDDNHAIFKGLDRTFSGWKTLTLAHPSWWMTNMVGGAINSFAAAGTRPERWPQLMMRYGETIRKLHGLSKKPLSRSKMIEWGGELLPETEVAEKLLLAGAVNPGRALIELISTGRVSAPNVLAKIREKGGVGAAVGKWFQFNAATDDLWRVITMADLIDQGHSYETARRLMVKALFDYGDLTQWEQEIGTRVWPFFRWTRNNSALQTKLLLEKPAFAASFPKLKQAIETALADEDLVPEEMRPRWMRDNIAAQITADGTKKFLLLSLFTPAQEVFELGQSLMGLDGLVETTKYVMSSTNPLIKMPFELAVGREIFTGRDIGNPEVGEPGVIRYLANQIRPYREVDSTLRSLRREDATIGTFLTRAVFGGRVQQFSDETLESRTEYEAGITSRKLRHEIKRSLQAGDQRRAMELSQKLVGQYRRLYRMGVTDLVPRTLRAAFIREEMQRNQ